MVPGTKVAEGDHGGPKWASFNMLFGLCVPQLLSVMNVGVKSGA
jgi:hypothetical protein